MLDSKESNQHPDIIEPDGSITDLEAAKLLLDAWKFRQSHAWSLLTRYYFAAVFVSAVPYMVEKKLVTDLDIVILALPILGGFLALAAIWLYAAEYIRAQSMNKGFRSLMKRYGFYELTHLHGFAEQILKPKIGWATIYILVLVSFSLSIANFLIVWDFVR